MTAEKLTSIAICGGGVGGLTLAAVLSQHCNIAVNIYEAQDKIAPLPTAIALWKRSWQVIQNLGLEEDIKKRNHPVPKEGESQGPVFRKADQKVGFDFHNHMMPYGPGNLPRPILAELLQTRLSNNCKIYLSKRLISYEENEEGGVTLYFADGSISVADVLIAADGTKSVCRSSMYKILGKREGREEYYEQFIEPKFSGTLVYRGTVPLQKFTALYPDHQVFGGPKLWCGKNKHVVTHPVKVADIILLICFHTISDEGAPYDGPWMVGGVEKNTVTDLYTGWEEDLVNLLEHIESPSLWAVHVVTPLPTFISGPVALIGDAAHSMTTHQGVDGAQAMEDAYILGRILAHPSVNKGNLQDALAIYEKIRLPIAQNAAALSKRNGLIYDFIDPICPQGDVSSPEGLKELGETVGKSFSWLAKGTLDEDWAETEQLLSAIRK